MKPRDYIIGALAIGGALTMAVEVGRTSDERALRFQLHGIEADREGEVLCALYASEESWLGDAPFRSDQVLVNGRSTVTCDFGDVPEGQYGAAALHDEDGDGEMDKNFAGLPLEGYSTSRNAHDEGIGAPDWEDAVFEYPGGVHTERADMDY